MGAGEGFIIVGISPILPIQTELRHAGNTSELWRTHFNLYLGPVYTRHKKEKNYEKKKVYKVEFYLIYI